ncbi:hypothetical protein FACS1894152_1880 [Bacilli bacterium]|nr:hypothetical protein FACS1894152_1880 [Bacilli bacterium]
MKRSLRSFLFLSFVLALRNGSGGLFFISDCFSVEEKQNVQKPENAIAVVDVAKIAENSDEFNEFKNKVYTEKATVESKAESEILKLREEQDDLKSKASLLSESALAEKMEKLQERYAKIQEEGGQRMNILQNWLNTAVMILSEAIKAIISEMVKEEKYKGYSVVIEKQACLYYNEKDDLTMEVLKRLNKKKLNIAIRAPKDNDKKKK